jgi:DNA-binding transcriptional ArsR family regulator/catechol 2,3-dioxygenase-like lactoylglutathione lyase family enzyme
VTAALAGPELVLRAIAHPARRALVERLRADGECSVTELARPFRMTQPAVSQHLRVLRQAGLVRGRRDGRRRLYHLDARPLQAIESWTARQRLRDPAGHVWSLAAAPGPAAGGGRPRAVGRSARARARPRSRRTRTREASVITHVKTVGVPVRDQTRAVEFYTQRLGFELRRDEAMGPDARWIEVAPPGARTAIVPYPAGFVPGGAEPGGFTNVVLACADARAAFAELTARGVEFTEPPAEQPWGGVLAQFRDADGNVFVLVQDG